jgi:DNA adenine methylase
MKAPSRLNHFSPLRYPGGKGKLAAYVKAIILENDLSDGEYVEPFAGGAAVAMELLLQEYVSSIRINDISRPVHAFWKSVLRDTDQLCKLIRDTPLTVKSWDAQKLVLTNASDHDTLALGFATFFLNRTNRSGILNGGIIGGRDQSGPWKIDARYNARELIFRVESIAKLKSRIHLTRQDAIKFLGSGSEKWAPKTLIYLDPPYYTKGRDLYYDYYGHEDHERLAMFVQKHIKKQHWIVSYDNAEPIRDLYSKCSSRTYMVGYSARHRSEGAEVMFFDKKLAIPELVGPITAVAA